jgi:hypothetical protein
MKKSPNISIVLIPLFFSLSKVAHGVKSLLECIDFYQHAVYTHIGIPQALANFVRNTFWHLARNLLQHSARHILQRESMI